MSILDKAAARIALVRMPGESDNELLQRIRAFYRARPYNHYLPLLTFLNSLGLQSTRYLLRELPRDR